MTSVLIIWETGTQIGTPPWSTLCEEEGRDQDIVKASIYKPRNTRLLTNHHEERGMEQTLRRSHEKELSLTIS